MEKDVSVDYSEIRELGEDLLMSIESLEEEENTITAVQQVTGVGTTQEWDEEEQLGYQIKDHR